MKDTAHQATVNIVALSEKDPDKEKARERKKSAVAWLEKELTRLQLKMDVLEATAEKWMVASGKKLQSFIRHLQEKKIFSTHFQEQMELWKDLDAVQSAARKVLAPVGHAASPDPMQAPVLAAGIPCAEATTASSFPVEAPVPAAGIPCAEASKPASSDPVQAPVLAAGIPCAEANAASSDPVQALVPAAGIPCAEASGSDPAQAPVLAAGILYAGLTCKPRCQQQASCVQKPPLPVQIACKPRC